MAIAAKTRLRCSGKPQTCVRRSLFTEECHRNGRLRKSRRQVGYPTRPNATRCVSGPVQCGPSMSPMEVYPVRLLRPEGLAHLTVCGRPSCLHMQRQSFWRWTTGWSSSTSACTSLPRRWSTISSTTASWPASYASTSTAPSARDHQSSLSTNGRITLRGPQCRVQWPASSIPRGLGGGCAWPQPHLGVLPVSPVGAQRGQRRTPRRRLETWQRPAAHRALVSTSRRLHPDRSLDAGPHDACRGSCGGDPGWPESHASSSSPGHSSAACQSGWACMHGEPSRHETGTSVAGASLAIRRASSRG